MPHDEKIKCIVTGAAGFIGSHIVDKLLEMGHDVIAIDNESAECNSQFYWNENAENFKYDISDYEKMRPLFDGVDYVFHLAAESRIQPAIINPIQAVMTNSVGTCTVLQCAREAGVSKVMYSSTSSGYGLTEVTPQSETLPDDCLNPYSVSKVNGEKLCKMYSDLFGVPTVVFRYFNVYGERQPLRGQYAPVVGLFLEQRKKGQPMTVVPDGQQRRDFTHVSDVVQANIKAMQTDTDKYGQVFNVGTGTNHSVLELAALISDEHVFIEPRIGEARTTLADNSKLRETFGWEPTVQLEDWIKEQLRIESLCLTDS